MTPSLQSALFRLEGLLTLAPLDGFRDEAKRALADLRGGIYELSAEVASLKSELHLHGPVCPSCKGEGCVKGHEGIMGTEWLPCPRGCPPPWRLDTTPPDDRDDDGFNY